MGKTTIAPTRRVAEFGRPEESLMHYHLAA